MSQSNQQPRTAPSADYWKNPALIGEKPAEKPDEGGVEVVPQEIDDKTWRLFLYQMNDRLANHAHLLRELYDLRESLTSWMELTDGKLDSMFKRLHQLEVVNGLANDPVEGQFDPIERE